MNPYDNPVLSAKVIFYVITCKNITIFLKKDYLVEGGGMKSVYDIFPFIEMIINNLQMEKPLEAPRRRKV